MLSEGLGSIYVTPVVALGPAVAIILAALAFTLLGETLAKVAAGQSSVAVAARVRGGAGRAADRPPGGGRGRRTEVLAVEGLTVAFPGGSVPVRDVSLQRAGGGDRRGRRRVGLREDAHGDGDRRPAAAERADDGGALRALRPRPARPLRGGAPEAVRAVARDRLPGSDVVAQPGPARRPAAREVAEVHDGLPRAQARQRSVDRLRSVRIAGAEARVRQYPHEFSGGMRQRAVIAMGLMIDPRLTIADEPTTALDVTVQQQILRLLRNVTESRDAAALFISHDVAVVSQLCSRVVVMYAGRIVEELDVQSLVDAPAHPYTAALIASVPTMESDRSQPLATIPGRAPGPFDQLARLPLRDAVPDRDRPLPRGAAAARPARHPAIASPAGTRSRATSPAPAPRSRGNGRTCSRDRARGSRRHRPLRTRAAAADGRRPRRSRRARADDGRPRRRVGLGQVDARPRARRARPARRGRGAASTTSACASRGTAAWPIAAAACR